MMLRRYCVRVCAFVCVCVREQLEKYRKEAERKRRLAAKDPKKRCVGRAVSMSSVKGG